MLAFGGYEEPGMLTEFEEKTGIKVNLKIHDGSDEEMIALMQTSSPGTFDVITPTSAYIPKAIEDGIIAELNPADFPLDDYFDIIAKWPPGGSLESCTRSLIVLAITVLLTIIKILRVRCFLL